MRANEFTFKKTVKRVRHFSGLSIDLTVNDAKLLRQALERGYLSGPAELGYEQGTDPDEVLVGAIWDQLTEFINRNDGKPSP